MYNNFVSDNLDKRGFINKEVILEYVTQEQVFGLVFKSVPVEFDYITSPLRKDRSPGCWFEYTAEGRLLFKDFGSSKTHYDCFDAVMAYYKLSNFFLTLEFVYNTLIKGKNIEAEKRIQPQIIKAKDPVRIIVESRVFEERDGNFFNPLFITKQNLIEDKVFPFSRYHLLNTKKGSFSKINYDIGYAFTDFPEGRKKLYFPYRTEQRFISTCNRNDIGGIKSLPIYGKQLIITKSWKDYRVLRNQGKNVIWLQNEGMVPDMELLLPILHRFKEVIILFDNDRAGIEASIKISGIINSHIPGKCKPLWLPERLLTEGITDPSDLLHKQGILSLSEFLKYRT